MKHDIIVIGNYPPPIGGVTIHIKRLLERIELSGLSCNFVDLRREHPLSFIRSIFKGRLIHLHTSNSTLKLAFSVICFLCRRTLLLTYHGNINRYGKFRNILDLFSLRLAHTPIMINRFSFEKVLAINRRAKFAPAFIPPISIDKLNDLSIIKIRDLRTRCKALFCTNAFDVSYDSSGNEIYQITQLIKSFNKFEHLGLIVSDPSGNYKNFVKSVKLNIPDNVVFFDYSHDFNAVIGESDCMIRYTTTDGDSLSVKEALFAGKNVLATNVVERPEQVILINNNTEELENAICSFKPETTRFQEDGFNDLFQIYNSLLNKQS